MKRIFVVTMLFVYLCSTGYSQKRWTGLGGDGLWTTAQNWSGNAVPTQSDDVILDNTYVSGSYMVTIPRDSTVGAAVCRTLTIGYPGNTNTITLYFASNKIVNGLRFGDGTAGTLDFSIDEGGVFINASYATTGTVYISRANSADTLRVKAGGKFIQVTERSFTTPFPISNTRFDPGSVFELNVRGASTSTPTVSGRTYGTFILAADSAGGTRSYAGASGSSAFTVTDWFIVKAGVNASLWNCSTAVHTINNIRLDAPFGYTSTATCPLRILGNIQLNASLTLSSTQTVTLNGTAQQTISGTSVTIPGTLEIDNTQGVVLNTSMTVSGTLTLTNGVVRTGANVLTANSVTRTNGYVDGILKKPVNVGTNVQVLYEVGTGNQYLPVTVRFTTVETQVYLTAQTVAQEHPNVRDAGIEPTKSINRYWNLDGTSIVFDSATVILRYPAEDVDQGSILSNFVLACLTPTAVEILPVSTITTTSAEVNVKRFGTFFMGEPVQIIPQYTITATAHGTGTIMPSGTLVVTQGETIRFTFAAYTGSRLDSVVVDGVKVDSTESYTFTTVSENHSIAVYFSPIQYTITATKYGNGTLNPSGNVLVQYGESISFTFAPEPGHRLDSVVVDGVKVDSTVSYTFTNVSKNHLIAVYFSPIQYTITATKYGNGTLNPSGNVLVRYGESISFAFTPEPGHRLDSVVVDGVKVDSTVSYTFTNVKVNHSIAVYFSAKTYTIRGTLHGNGVLTPNGSVTVKHGESCRFTFSPNLGHRLDSVIVDGIRVDSTSGFTFTNVTSNHTIDVYFSVIPTSVLGMGTVPRETRIYGNYPNPFNPSTTIRFSVATSGHAVVSIYNVLGQRIAELFNGIAEAGKYYEVIFEADMLPSGVYVASLETSETKHVRKILLMK